MINRNNFEWIRIRRRVRKQRRSLKTCCFAVDWNWIIGIGRIAADVDYGAESSSRAGLKGLFGNERLNWFGKIDAIRKDVKISEDFFNGSSSSRIGLE